jgi:spoIIIJ-associated protein
VTDTSIPRTEEPTDEENSVASPSTDSGSEAPDAAASADASSSEASLADASSADASSAVATEEDKADDSSANGADNGKADDGELFRQSEIAADYVEGLLDILDYDGDIDELVSAGRPVVEVVGGRLQPLVGQRGATLEALQELTRLAIFRQTGSPSRLLLDVGGYRANRRKELAAVAKNAVEKVKEYGEPVRLEPMSAFERKCVHDVVNALAGVESESEGVEPHRRIVVRPVS